MLALKVLLLFLRCFQVESESLDRVSQVDLAPFARLLGGLIGLVLCALLSLASLIELLGQLLGRL